MRTERPTRAFVLAAGFGTRLLPLTRDIPKPLLPVWNIPVIERTLAMLATWGVRDVLVNIHHRADRMLDHIRARPRDRLRVAVSFEADILGTGGALRKAEWFFADGKPAWLVNGDVLAELDPRPLLTAFDERRTIASAWVYEKAGPRTVEVRRGAVADFRSKNPGAAGTRTFTGVQILNPVLLDRARGYLPAEVCFAGLIEAYERAMKDGWRVAAVASRGTWADIGTPEQLIEAHRLHRGVKHFRAVAAGATVERGAVVRDSVVLPGAVVRKGARVERAIVGPGAIVAGRAQRLALRGDRALDAGETQAVRALGWEPEETTVIALSPRGSARSFIRIRRGRDSAMLVHYDPSREENTFYAGHARFLRSLRMSVPRVLADLPRMNLTIFEDLGDVTAGDLLKARGAGAFADLYRRLIDAMVVFHEAGGREARRRRIRTMPHFRPRLYRWERGLFAGEFLSRRLKLRPSLVEDIRKELQTAGRRLARAPLVLVHRDLQSSNVLVRDGRPFLIDFQGMRLGPAAYDLASLLCDPYVAIPPRLRSELLARYAAKARDGESVKSLFWYGAIQRLVQALGAFARLSAKPETASFAGHIPVALERLQEALDHVDGFPRLKAMLNGARHATGAPRRG